MTWPAARSRPSWTWGRKDVTWSEFRWEKRVRGPRAHRLPASSHHVRPLPVRGRAGGRRAAGGRTSRERAALPGAARAEAASPLALAAARGLTLRLAGRSQRPVQSSAQECPPWENTTTGNLPHVEDTSPPSDTTDRAFARRHRYRDRTLTPVGGQQPGADQTGIDPILGSAVIAGPPAGRGCGVCVHDRALPLGVLAEAARVLAGVLEVLTAAAADQHRAGQFAELPGSGGGTDDGH